MPNKTAIVRCPIHGSIQLNSRELALIDHPFFQRLRYISQLGFASFVFPGAVHTRFSHSLGAIHLAGLVFNQIIDTCRQNLRRFYSREQLDYFHQIVRFASLLHDLGHPPFSHAAESILPPLSSINCSIINTSESDRQSTHEDFSQLIIYHLATEEGLLTIEEAEDIISLLSKDFCPSDRMLAESGKPMIYPLLCQLINGEIDVDRMDYLLRDSYFAGVPYGKYDLDRLITSFSCCLEEESQHFLLSIDGEGVPSYEIFLLARVHMFYQIYFHKSLGAYRFYLKKVFETDEIDYKITGELENYLFLTETKLIELLRTNSEKKWSGKIYHRVPAKSLIRVLDGEKNGLDRLERVKKILQDNSIETISAHSSNQYSSQNTSAKIDENTILVVDEQFGKTTVSPLASNSSLLGRNEKLIEIHQLYVHREDYAKVIKLIRKAGLNK